MQRPSHLRGRSPENVNQIHPKMNPLQPQNPQDNLSLTSTQKLRNETAKQENRKILFDPAITCQKSLAECFHVFTDSKKIAPVLARRTPTTNANTRHREIEIFTDGACICNGKRDANAELEYGLAWKMQETKP